MVPEYPRIAAGLNWCYREYVRREVGRHLGHLSEIRSVLQFEGTETVLTRADGSRENVGMVRIEAGGRVFTRTSTLDTILTELSSLALDMAHQQSRSVYAAMDKVCEESGQTFDARGQRLDADLFLKALEMVEIDFDDLGRPRLPTLVVGGGPDAVRTLLSQQDDPEVKKRFDALISDKYEAWRDREASRKLAG
jgi:hypothetical protein